MMIWEGSQMSMVNEAQRKTKGTQALLILYKGATFPLTRDLLRFILAKDSLPVA